jgi:hypothetical protein
MTTFYKQYYNVQKKKTNVDKLHVIIKLFMYTGLTWFLCHMAQVLLIMRRD